MEQLHNILFIDIETATGAPSFSHLSENMQEQWKRKAKILLARSEEDKDTAQFYEEKAAIFAEFGKVVCIGLGAYIKEEHDWKFVMKSITDDDEKILLNEFADAVSRFGSQRKQVVFCGHNIKEFDIPFLCRRMLIHGISLPKAMQLHGKKPWDVPHIDTLELWRFGDYKHYITLALLAEILGIPSPKDDIDGSMVSALYWKENDKTRIGTYCLKDVHTTAAIYLKLKNIADMHAEKVYL